MSKGKKTKLCQCYTSGSLESQHFLVLAGLPRFPQQTELRAHCWDLGITKKSEGASAWPQADSVTAKVTNPASYS